MSQQFLDTDESKIICALIWAPPQGNAWRSTGIAPRILSLGTNEACPEIFEYEKNPS